jgi:predicted ABC-type ATPase
VRQRVLLYGHDVPEDRIRDRYRRSLALLPQAMAAVDLVVLYDNSYGDPAVIRPFFQMIGDEKLVIERPLPTWALPALRPWLGG